MPRLFLVRRAKDTQRLHDLLKEGRELKATAGGN